MTEGKLEVGDFVCLRSSSGIPQIIGVVLARTPAGTGLSVAWMNRIKEWWPLTSLRLLAKKEIVKWWEGQK